MRSVSELIFKQLNWEVAAAAGQEGKGGDGVRGGGTKGEGKRKLQEKGKGKGGSQPERARGAFEAHAKRSLRGCFSDFSGKSAMTDYEFALENIGKILEKLASEEARR